jgi:hypothetical protein
VGFEEFLEDLKRRHPEWFGAERTGRPQDVTDLPKAREPQRAVSRPAPAAPVAVAAPVEEGPEVVEVDDEETEWWNL